ncbi:hypothetical protein JCM16814_34640 [Desulfobaculum senezii]
MAEAEKVQIKTNVESELGCELVDIVNVLGDLGVPKDEILNVLGYRVNPSFYERDDFCQPRQAW